MLVLTCVVGTAVCLAIGVRFAFSLVEVRGMSMVPKLYPSDKVVAFRFWPSAWLRAGMTIVFQYPEPIAQRRVAANREVNQSLPMDAQDVHQPTSSPTLHIKLVAAISGEPIPRGTSAPGGTRKSESARPGVSVVPPGHVFVMGSSDVSIDSRQWGPVRLPCFVRLVLFRLAGERQAAGE